MMIIVWGEPEEFSHYENFSSWDECSDECNESDDCMLVYNNLTTGECQLFRFSNITKVRKLDGTDGKVGFKKTITTCPSNDDPPLFGKNSTSETYIVGQSIYESTVTSDDDSRTFEYSILTCPSTSRPFSRDDVSVCIGVVLIDGTTGNYSDASDLCRTGSGMSLTGPYSSDEATYLIAQSSSGIWMDGMSILVVREFVMEDDTHNGTFAYPFRQQQPDSTVIDQCLFQMPSRTVVDDAYCSQDLAGTMCRMNPVVAS